MAKAFQYFELTFSDNTKSDYSGLMPAGIMMQLLDEFIAETNSKEGKVLREFVFDEIVTFDWKGNTGAYSMEFMNERNRKNYMQARKPFEEWLKNKGVEMTYSLSHSIPSSAVDLITDGNYEESTYYNVSKKYLLLEIPASRGFAIEE